MHTDVEMKTGCVHGLDLVTESVSNEMGNIQSWEFSSAFPSLLDVQNLNITIKNGSISTNLKTFLCSHEVVFQRLQKVFHLHVTGVTRDVCSGFTDTKCFPCCSLLGTSCRFVKRYSHSLPSRNSLPGAWDVWCHRRLENITQLIKCTPKMF